MSAAPAPRPQTSIKYAGIPWEMGLAEAHQVLTLNGLRHRVRLRTDGGLKTGRDIVIAAILGAEEFGIGTAQPRRHGLHHGAPVPFQHLPGRRLHAGRRACAQKFTGTPEKVINLLSFIAEEVREILASLGFRSLDEVIGRTELLEQVSRGADAPRRSRPQPAARRRPTPATSARYCTLRRAATKCPTRSTRRWSRTHSALFERGEKMQLDLQRAQHPPRHRHARCRAHDHRASSA